MPQSPDEIRRENLPLQETPETVTEHICLADVHMHNQYMDLWKKSYLYVQTLWQLPHKKHRQHPYVPEMMQLPAEK